MDVRLVFASLLLLGVSAVAQQGQPAAPAKPVPAAQPGKPVQGKQDPDRPGPTPVDVIGDLTREKERLEQEIAYAKERVKGAKTMLAQKFAPHPQSFKAIDAGTNAAATPAPAMHKARIMTAKELEGQPEDLMLLVNGQAIRRGAYDEMMNYMRSVPSTGEDSLRSQTVLFEMIRTQAVAAAFPENGAEGQIGDILGQIETGKPIADFAKSVGTIQGAKDDGSIEVTRHSFLGPKIEQLAFTVEPGHRSRPFRTPMGLAILQVDSVEKGATPDLDKVKAHIVQAQWQTDPAAMQKAQANAASGQAEILVRDQEVLDLLPALYKPMAAPAKSDAELSTLLETLAQLEAAKEKLSGTSDPTPSAKAQIDQMQKQIERIKGAIQEIKAKTTDSQDADHGKDEKVAPAKTGEKK